MFKKLSIWRKLIIKSSLLLILLISNNILYAENNIADIKQYINSIDSIALDFLQTDSYGNKAEGTLVIDKPYKFRCNYYPPFPLLIIGNSNYVSVYDYEMKHLSRIKANENIFNFLLVDDINFSDNFEILSIRNIDKQYSVKVRSSNVNKISEISFDKKTKNIEQMIIYEDDNIITIKFTGYNRIINVSSTLFTIQNPNIYGNPSRLTKQELYKMFTMRAG